MPEDKDQEISVPASSVPTDARNSRTAPARESRQSAPGIQVAVRLAKWPVNPPAAPSAYASKPAMYKSRTGTIRIDSLGCHFFEQLLGFRELVLRIFLEHVEDLEDVAVAQGVEDLVAFLAVGD